ncbi:MAG: PrsW family intramembrane metalloprotease [Candidatus Micrarchaeota archaeon]|nr:PrsW family intramembrane metalloprotease [Candidatus Micrarchaeota archaeon]
MQPLALFLILFASIAYPDSVGEELADFDYGLEAKYSFENTNLTTSPQLILVKITATNPFNSSLPLYLLRQEEDGWKVVKLLGALPPNKESTIELEIEVEYQKVISKKTRYAIAGRGPEEKIYGSLFYVEEDWSGYEKSIEEGLSALLLFFVPLAALVSAVLVIFLAYSGYFSKKSDAEKNLKEMVSPLERQKGELGSKLLMNPFVVAAELFCVLLLVAVLFNNLLETHSSENAIKVLAVALLGSLAIPLLYFAACWYLEKKEEGKPISFFVGMFVWGMFAAFLSLLVSSSATGELQRLGLFSTMLVATLFVSPIVEEIIKGIGVLAMSGNRQYNDTLTGLLLGFSCGVGFALVENWFYFSSKANPFEIGGLERWLVLILYRSFFNTLAHGCFTASAAALIGYIKSIPSLRQFAALSFLPGILIAIFLHGIFNLSAVIDGLIVDGRQAIFFVFNPMLVILMAAMFFLVLVLALIDEKKRKVAGG